jgi:hypothetical protein
MMLTAEIADDRFPGGRLTIVATHLEDKTKPEGRRKSTFTNRVLRPRRSIRRRFRVSVAA